MRRVGRGYQKMVDAYIRIFTRCGLRFKVVEAESGLIGGSYSHEFMVLAETGEETIVSCTRCSYAANIERADFRRRETEIEPQALKPLRKVTDT